MTEKGAPVTWSSLPRKDQLFLLFMIRFSEPVVRMSISAYIYYQLQSLDPSLSSAEIITQSAYLQTAYTVAQCISSLLWGAVSDSPRGGRKLVVLISLFGSFVSCSLFGFITSFKQAVLLRVFEGITNGTVAMVRTMVSEVVQEKKYQARAFALLPIATRIAIILSPLVAGWTVQLETSGEDHGFFDDHPYALPALLNAGFLLLLLIGSFLFLEEYQPITDDEDGEEMGLMKQVTDDEESSGSKTPGVPAESEKKAVRLPTSRMFTKNMVLMLLASVIYEFHLNSASVAMPSMLVDPVSSIEAERSRSLPFRFGGGAGFAPRSLAWYSTVFGIVGIPMQIFVYPYLAQRLGSIKLWRRFYLGFPLLYFLYPYVAVMPSSTPPPSEKTGVAVWAYLVFIQTSTALIASLVTPSQLVLTNFSSPHPSALGRTHSINFFNSMAVRASSSALAGNLYAFGSTHNLTGIEGNGHESKLPGDD
ncbi:putative membrane protein [Colletotrichum trifolii]|uniref:Putative membrane protein n=1 Tax=Colletotrichum trifolii TaxID=5466 RepID=A0A4R8RKP1_COLTR|nr:putative membrane protein [Colletotrichum trifolii]